MAPTPAVPAATVVLLRAAAQGIEVLLVRRDDRVAFMGGAHVFPGGRVEGRDELDDVLRRCALADPGRMAGVTSTEAIALHVAAIRELFEEAGILLARDERGALAAIHGAARDRFDAYRRELTSGRITLLDILEAERLSPACETLAYFAHWVTPEIETRRFDTRFFAAAAPEAQDASHDDAELTHSVWIAPGEAIAACERGDIALPPPTWTTLRWLSAFDDVERAIAWARTRQVARVQPGFVEDGARRIVLLPGDPDYPPIDGFAAAETRFILEGGRWTPVRPRTAAAARDSD